MRRLCITAALALGWLALAMTVLPIVSARPASKASPSNETDNPCGYGFQISTIPSLATQDDAVEVTYSAVWPYLPTPEHQSHEVVSNVIRLDAIYYVPEVVLPVIVDWGGSADVGRLPTGTYSVEVYLTTVHTPAVLTELCGTKSFVVYERLYRLYLPIVAKQAAQSLPMLSLR
jgi:hypothetical protein